MDKVLITKHFAIYGKVQGVGFRYFTWKKAKQWQITGWVKNLADNSVQVLAQGSHENLTLFKQWLEQGPPQSRVELVLELNEPQFTEQIYSQFSIKY
ncbi:acylphosphatase [Volucribacter psittacicida]|uniref:acylphosphatase n=1 Tax=Volucribacter psittacicida TaxID=203482 RepID=A0A4R1FNR4_9PAST|nr:acylphosphatase [Volucribacter psittacicida]TCJ96193.1 acylphosphatase [Volucribacter psittacicida]